MPKGAFPLGAGLSPLAVADHATGTPLVQAQVHVVSRYPTGEPDVVEILAPVHLTAAERSGSQIAYEVLRSPGKIATEPEVPPSVAELLARRKPGRFGIRARDVYGNVYWAELSGSGQAPGFGSLQLTKNGPWLRERRVYATRRRLELRALKGLRSRTCSVSTRTSASVPGRRSSSSICA